MGLKLTINGVARELEGLESPSGLAAVVGQLGLKSDRVAVELNGEIARRETWGSTEVASGDKLEVVHFVGGGTPPGCMEVDYT
jgi:sulfur carrier protein